MKKESVFLQSVLAKGGILAEHLPGYEERLSQMEMAEAVMAAYVENKTSLIEAGTGTGKSLSYLLPAIYFALKKQEKTVIATHTIALQEQLIQRDIPFILNVLDLDLKAVLVKGMNNYLCLKRFEDLEGESSSMALEDWAERTEEGSKSTINFPISHDLWDRVKAEKGSCTRNKCPHYKECFFFKARKKVEEAQILVVNHHLLLADLLGKGEGAEREWAILPSEAHVVIDEAHHLEEVATEALSNRFDKLSLIHLFHALDPLILADSALLKKSEEALKESLIGFIEIEQFLPRQKEERWMMEEIDHEGFYRDVAPFFEKAEKALSSFAEEVRLFSEKIETKEISALGSKIKESAKTLNAFLARSTEGRVKWIEKRVDNWILVDCCLEVSKHLPELLFKAHPSVVLCSATLATGGNFDFVKERLGLKQVESAIYDSPFDYDAQALFAVPSDIVDPTHPDFTSQCAEYILEAIKASEGNAFILFTSYEMLRAVYGMLEGRDKGFCFMKQGDSSRTQLLKDFITYEKSVLFATDSFWEGVDVAGEDLRLVVLVKIPFKVPSSPLVKAHQKLLVEQNKDPFSHYTIPHAVVKFKQGFGRLIRSRSDVGVVLCLDKRIFTKSYGKVFLNSLPPCKKIYDKRESIVRQMKEKWSIAGSNR